MESEKAGQVEYHYGFYAAIHFDYDVARLDLTFRQEHELGDRPVRLDMAIVKRNKERRLTDPIGRAFKKHNILEYKSPGDSLSIDDLYKVQGYACIYKSLGKTVNAIPIEELAVSIFCHAYPRKLFALLKATGFSVEGPHEGIYHVEGPLCVPTQVVAISRLPGGGYEELKILAPNAKREDVVRFLDRASQGPSEHASAILRVSMAANKALYQKLREEGPMRDVFEDIFHKELAKERTEGLTEGRREGLTEGRREGLTEGRREGLTEGRREERANIISRMLAGGMTPEQISDLIALPLAEVLALRGGA